MAGGAGARAGAGAGDEAVLGCRSREGEPCRQARQQRQGRWPGNQENIYRVALNLNPLCDPFTNHAKTQGVG